MKLLSCRIDNFGKLSDFSMDFSGGMNVINQSNGWGKSTLAAFLRIMFYGFEGKKESGSFEKERVVYAPWQGGTYGGSVDFSVGGKRYRISRTFGKTEKTDTFTLYDLDTNLESHDFSKNIGEELFDLDSSSFRRSVFIAQSDCASDTTDGIHAKLGHLVENTNDINNFETAIHALKDKMNKLTPDRATGSIKRRKSVLTQLEVEIRAYEDAMEAQEKLSKKLAELEARKEELIRTRKVHTEQLKIAGEASHVMELQKSYLSMCEEAKQQAEALTKYEQIFPKEVPSDEEFATAISLADRLVEQKGVMSSYAFSQEEAARILELGDMFDKGVPTEEEIGAMLSGLEQLNAPKSESVKLSSSLDYYEKMALTEQEEAKPAKMNGLLLVGIIIIFIAVVLGVCYFVPTLAALASSFLLGAAICGGMGLLLVLIGIIMLSGENKRRREAGQKAAQEHQAVVDKAQEIHGILSECQKKIRAREQETEAFLAKYHLYGTTDAYAAKLYELKTLCHEYQRLIEKRRRYNETKESCAKMAEELTELEQYYGFSLGENYGKELGRLRGEAMEFSLAYRNYEALLAKKASFEKENDIAYICKEVERKYSLDELNGLLLALDEELNEVANLVEQNRRQLDEVLERLDLKDEKEQELEYQMQMQEEEMAQYEVLSQTSDFLSRAKEQFMARYMAPISNAFSHYYETLLGQQEGEWMIDANIRFQKREQGQMRETKWLSAGYQDLIGVCMRFALVDAMYKEEKPFLILDDPFVNLDGEKLLRGKELLQGLEKEYQVIYFTCHDSRI